MISIVTPTDDPGCRVGSPPAGSGTRSRQDLLSRFARGRPTLDPLARNMARTWPGTWCLIWSRLFAGPPRAAVPDHRRRCPRIRRVGALADMPIACIPISLRATSGAVRSTSDRANHDPRHGAKERSSFPAGTLQGHRARKKGGDGIDRGSEPHSDAGNHRAVLYRSPLGRPPPAGPTHGASCSWTGQVGPRRRRADAGDAALGLAGPAQSATPATRSSGTSFQAL